MLQQHIAHRLQVLLRQCVVRQLLGCDPSSPKLRVDRVLHEPVPVVKMVNLRIDAFDLLRELQNERLVRLPRQVVVAEKGQLLGTFDTVLKQRGVRVEHDRVSARGGALDECGAGCLDPVPVPEGLEPECGPRSACGTVELAGRMGRVVVVTVARAWSDGDDDRREPAPDVFRNVPLAGAAAGAGLQSLAARDGRPRGCESACARRQSAAMRERARLGRGVPERSNEAAGRVCPDDVFAR